MCTNNRGLIVSKKPKVDDVVMDYAKQQEDRVRVLEAQLIQLEQTRCDQVQELLCKQQELMSSVAELLTRCVR